ncbi:MAG: diacylglycerol kinase family lipid kinase [Acidobacteria bacterium]|nr:diacylglycerol kinase family lipid kinase [Acidobacteriota bacterium]
MSRSTTVLISNPRAGQGGAQRAREVARFREAMLARGVELEVLNTTAQDEATQLAAQAAADGVETIIVSGGDGTINEAVQGLVGTRARLAIWPRGTANVLAREIGMPVNYEQAAEIIARGKTKRIYPGCAVLEGTGARRYFLLMAGIGLDASVVEGTRPALKRRFGKAAFWYAGLEHLARWKPVSFELEVEGEMLPATFAAVGKGSLYGGGLRLTPRARLDEPLFEICIIKSESRLRYLRLLPATLGEGLADDPPDILFRRATRARVTGRVAVQVDGELIGHPPMTFEVVNETIELVVP